MLRPLQPLLLPLQLLACSLFSTKNKTNKSAYKRFHELADGGYGYRKAGRNHNFAKKSGVYRSRIRHEGLTTAITARKLRDMYVRG